MYHTLPFCDSTRDKYKDILLLCYSYITITDFSNIMESKVRHFDGNGDVRVFLEKVSLHSALKGYDRKKTAQDLTSKLEGRAFDVYMRLADTD